MLHVDRDIGIVPGYVLSCACNSHVGRPALCRELSSLRLVLDLA